MERKNSMEEGHVKTKRKFLLSIWEDPSRAPRLALVMIGIRRWGADPVLRGAPLVEPFTRYVVSKTVKNLVSNLVAAEMLKQTGRYLRSTTPKRTYRRMPGGWYARDTRRFWLADWPESEATSGDIRWIADLAQAKTRSAQLAKSLEGTQR